MSIESSIDALTAAVKENTETLKAAMTGKASATTAPKGDDKEKPAPRSRSTKAADKAPSTADMKKAAESFLDKAGNDEDDYNKRRAHIKKVIAKFDAPKFTEIGEDDRKDAIAMLTEFDEDGAGDDEGRGRREDETDI